ncbi:hypothetical protein EIW28_11210 [Glycomyces terrestris]|uniref:Uncharacterized protein n=1 Tax=Glycomyces terrestris TaxID=2493553 RepID=A0A426UXN6_9ACTN|nr:hypothetical protein EIW28_11210 [Glycomyces terrestris]
MREPRHKTTAHNHGTTAPRHDVPRPPGRANPAPADRMPRRTAGTLRPAPRRDGGPRGAGDRAVKGDVRWNSSTR